jgi:hypothetical protein
LLAASIAAALAAGLAVGGNGETNKKTFEHAIGLWGDLPYSRRQHLRAEAQQWASAHLR